MTERAMDSFTEEVILELGFEECFGVFQIYKREKGVFLIK